MGRRERPIGTMQRNVGGAPRDRRIWTGGAQGQGNELFVPGDVDRLLAQGQRCSINVLAAQTVPGLVDFLGRELTGLALLVTQMSGGAYRADVALYMPPGGEELIETKGLPGRVSPTNRYCVAIDWDAAIDRLKGTGDAE
jgi:hypothetical protein